MPSLGSVTEGMLGTQLDLQNIQMNNQKIQAGRVDLIKDKIQLAQQMKMLSLMQGLKPGEAGNPDEMAGLMDQVSMMQLESGMPVEAGNTMKVATSIRENSSLIDYRSYRLQSQRLGEFANILSSVPDTPQGYKQAIALMQITDPGAIRDPKFQQLSKQQWQPGLINSLKASVLNAKDKAEIKYRQQVGQHAEAAAKADEARVDQIKTMTKYYKDRDAAIGKEGGSPPKAADLQAVTDMATRDFPGADPADIRVRSRPLAEQMVQLMKSDHLTRSEAAARVYALARKNGTFNGLRNVLGRKGSSPKNPLPAPADPTKILDNQWYTDKDGEPVLSLGGRFYTQDELAGDEAADEAISEDSKAGEDDEGLTEEERAEGDDLPAREK